MRLAVIALFVLAHAAVLTGCVASKCDESGLTCAGIPGANELDAGQVTRDAGSE
jgi:hypothetical protein